MTCMGLYEVKSPICGKFKEKNKYIRTIGMLEIRFTYLCYIYQLNEINTSVTYTKYVMN